MTAPATTDMRATITGSPVLLRTLNALRDAAPDLTTIPPLTYTRYRAFDRTGERGDYQVPYFQRRAMLTRAVIEYIAADADACPPLRDTIHDLLWAICEEVTWVVPAHEDQGPARWDYDRPDEHAEPLGADTVLTRPPARIDLFAAETGASLSEVIALIGEDLAPEVCERVRHEVTRRILTPYLAHAREHWWFNADLNWNGVCNGAVALAFLHLERDSGRLDRALSLCIESLTHYLDMGFHDDGSTVEGVGYWNFGLMYLVAAAELLRVRTAGEVDLLAHARLPAIARYPLHMALTAPQFLNFGDGQEMVILSPGIVTRLAERAETPALRALIGTSEGDTGSYALAKLAIVVRQLAWWDGQYLDPLPPENAVLPDIGVVKLVGSAHGVPLIVGAIAGDTDGHHNHMHVASIIVHYGDETLIVDPGRGRYTRAYFRAARRHHPFVSADGHNVPRISGSAQVAGRAFGGKGQFHGTLTAVDLHSDWMTAMIDFHRAYDLPTLSMARRRLTLAPSGAITLQDSFAFEGEPLPIVEAFMTWGEVTFHENSVTITGARRSIRLTAPDAHWVVEHLTEASRANDRSDTLKRITVAADATEFHLTITPLP